MNIIQLTPGAGKMFCGNCLRDNALVAALRGLGHEALMVPLYLPLTLDEPDQSSGTPIFFSGINVYLEQKSAFFRRAPAWLHNILAARPLLAWAAGRAAKTRADELGELTLSMLRGEHGNQARELDGLINWLRTQPKPDVICLSNVLLVGMAHRLKSELGAPVLCMLQGEDSFLDGLPESHRDLCWRTLGEQGKHVDMFIAPSQYFAELMQNRLGLSPERVEVVHNGINLEGYPHVPISTSRPGVSGKLSLDSEPHAVPPVLGYFARMCSEKGLPLLIEAFVKIRQRGRVPKLRLRVGGSCGPADEALVAQLRQQLTQAGLIGDVDFCPNLDRAAKIAFLRDLSVFSVPATYGEAFGLYLIEALAVGVPVVQPRSASFPELVEATGGGLLCAANNADALAEAIESLLENPQRARALGEAGREAVFEKFSVAAMTQAMLSRFEALSRRNVHVT
jgi:glycosyltransferase involved in cell wall biosynthesis